MGSESGRIAEVFRRKGRTVAVNWILFLFLFLCYALVFTVPKFYGAVDGYVSPAVFGILCILYLNNAGLSAFLKGRDKEMLFVVLVVLLNTVNFFLIGSNKGAILTVANLLMIFLLSARIELTKRQREIIPILYFLYFCYLLFYDTQYGDMFTYNTNTFATATIFTLLVAMCGLIPLSRKHDGLGALIVFGIVAGFRLVLWHRARGAFIMLAGFLFFFYIWPKRWWRNKKVFTGLFLLATAGSLLFVAFYVLLGATGVNFVMPFFYKPLFSGRNRIWLEIFHLFRQRPLTGIGTGMTLDAFWEFNIHNSMYDLLAVHGIPVFLCILAFLYRRMKMLGERAALSRGGLCALCAVFAVLFESFFDNDLIWANYTLNLLFLLLAAGAAPDGAGERDA